MALLVRFYWHDLSDATGILQRFCWHHFTVVCTNLWVIDYVTDNSDKDIYQKDIEAEFSINRATASKMLSLMEEKKFISRVSLSEDRRLKKIVILPEGRKLKEICLAFRKEMEQELTSALSEEEIKFLKKILRKMAYHFDEIKM